MLAGVFLAFPAAADMPLAQALSSPGAAAPASSGRPIPSLTPQQWLLVVNVVSAPLILGLLWAGNVIRPGSLAGGRAVSGHPWWIWLFAAIVVWMAVQVGAGAAGSIPAVKEAAGSLKGIALMQGGGYLLGILSAFFMLRLLAAGASGAGLSVRAKDIPIGLGCLLLAYPILDLAGRAGVWIATKVSGERPDVLAHDVLRTIVDQRDSAWAWAVGLTVIVLAPIVEEIIYRGLLQSAAVSALKKPWLGILASSAVFAGVHYAAVPPHALANLFVLGVAMGIAYERTKSLGVPIIMHIGFNAANVGLALWLA